MGGHLAIGFIKSPERVDRLSRRLDLQDVLGVVLVDGTDWASRGRRSTSYVLHECFLLLEPHLTDMLVLFDHPVSVEHADIRFAIN